MIATAILALTVDYADHGCEDVGMNIFGSDYGIFGEKDPRGMSSHHFFGMKRIDYSTAVRADVSKQNYSICPRHWYIDVTITCQECSDEFTFSASEQRFWYEEMHFWVDSRPIRCASCRKSLRALVELRKRYDSLIAAALGACPLEAKQEVVAIIDELESAAADVPEKMKQNRSVLLAQLKKAS